MNNEDYMMDIYDENGNLIKIEVLDIFEVEGYDKKYIIYSKGEIENDNERVYVSILEYNENKSTFKPIEDDKEWEDVREALENRNIGD